MIKVIKIHEYEFIAETEDRMSQHGDAAELAITYICEKLQFLSVQEAKDLHEKAFVDPKTTPEQDQLDRIADRATTRAFKELGYFCEPRGAYMSLHAKHEEA